MDLRQYLQRLRERAKLTVPEVADRVGVARVTAYSWENQGSNQKNPEPKTLQKLLDLYEATDDERLIAWSLLGGAETTASAPAEAK